MTDLFSKNARSNKSNFNFFSSNVDLKFQLKNLDGILSTT